MLKKTKNDYLHSATKVALSTIPIVGGVASELFSLTIAAPLEKRRDNWLKDIDKRLSKLEEKYADFHISDLSENDHFISLFLTTTQLALRNHQSEKIIALRNILLNSAIRKDIDEEYTQLFINMIDSFTSWHLLILKFLQNPMNWLEDNDIPKFEVIASSINRLIIHSFKELSGKDGYLRLIAEDLHGKGLLTINSFQSVMKRTGIYTKRTTNLGDYFISLIEEP